MQTYLLRKSGEPTKLNEFEFEIIYHPKPKNSKFDVEECESNGSISLICTKKFLEFFLHILTERNNVYWKLAYA